MDYFLETFRKYAEFDGRSSRKEFWLFVLFNMVACAAIQLITGRHSIILQLYQLVLLIPMISVAVRRMHDVGKSAWFILIPVYNLVLYCTQGDTGANKYGAEPRDLK